MLVTRSFAAGCWGIDVSEPLSEAVLDKIVSTPLPNGKPVEFIIRYVFFRAPGPSSDLTAAEARAIWARKSLTGRPLGLHVVIHPRLPRLNTVSGPIGSADAAAAIRNCLAAGYDPAQIRPDAGPPRLSPDIEGVLSDGPSSVAYLHAIVGDIAAAKFGPMPYLGYRTKLAAADLASCPGSPEWWADFEALANHPQPPKPWAVHQHPQIPFCGVAADPDEVVGDGFVAVVDDGTATRLDGEPAVVVEAPPMTDEGALPPAGS